MHKQAYKAWWYRCRLSTDKEKMFAVSKLS